MVSYEDLAQDRLGVANRVLGFLNLPRLEPGDLPAVRYRQQADTLTERYTKRDTDSGQYIEQKKDGKPFKGVRKEK